MSYCHITVSTLQNSEWKEKTWKVYLFTPQKYFPISNTQKKNEVCDKKIFITTLKCIHSCSFFHDFYSIGGLFVASYVKTSFLLVRCLWCLLLYFQTKHTQKVLIDGLVSAKTFLCIESTYFSFKILFKIVSQRQISKEKLLHFQTQRSSLFCCLFWAWEDENASTSLYIFILRHIRKLLRMQTK